MCTRLNLVEQSRVLDRDHRLVSKGRNQRNLLVSEWLHLGATDSNYANRLPSSQQRDGESCPETMSKCHLAAIRELVRGRLKVGHVNRGTIDKGTSTNGTPSDRQARNVHRNRSIMRPNMQ